MLFDLPEDIYTIIIPLLDFQDILTIRETCHDAQIVFCVWLKTNQLMLNDVYDEDVIQSTFVEYDINYLNLKLNSYHITNYSLPCLSNCRTLDLTWCFRITDDGLKHLENCINLILRGCHNITDYGLQFLRNCVNLDIRFCINITDQGLKHLGDINKCKN